MARYFVDAVAGSDANAGTSKTAPWARAPGMKNGSGTAHTSGFGVVYAPAPGDEFVFKGGVTWLACYPWTITWSNTTWDTDPTWFNGTSFTKPSFDAQRNQSFKAIVFIHASNVTLDGLDLKNFAPQTTFQESGTIAAWGSFNGIRITNCLIRDWWFSDANIPGSLNSPPGTAVNASGAQITVDNCEVTQVGAGTTLSGTQQATGACFNNIANAHHNHIHHVATVFQGGGFGSEGYHDNWIHDCLVPSDDQPPYAPSGSFPDHSNVFSIASSAKIYNNLVYNLPGQNGPIQFPGFSSGNNHILVYNNVFYNTGGQPAVIPNCEANWSTTTLEIYNNTFLDSGQGCVRVVNRGQPSQHIGTLIVRNNHMITVNGDADGVVFDSGTVVDNYIHDHNLKQSPSAATSAGYTASNNYQPTNASSPTVNSGADLSSTGFPLITADRLGVPRAAPWDRGAYEFAGQQPQNQPFISLNPTSLDWGSVTVGGTIPDKTVTVSNTGTATLNWSVSVPAPYSVVGAASGTLTASQSTQVIFRFGPTSAGTYNLTAAFSGAQGATLALNGSATAPISGLSFPADAGTISGAFTVDSTNHTITASSTVNTPGAGGQARYNVTIPSDGDYVVNTQVNAPDGASNSFWINFDTDPTDPAMVWDVVQFTSGLQSRIASWRGTGTFDQPQFSPKVWTLQAGQHQLIIFGRESNAQIGQITIQAPAPVIPPAPAAPASPSPAHNATNVSINTSLTWAESTSGTQFNVSLGTVNPPPLVASGINTTSYTPSAVLANATIYYWQVRSYINWSSAGQSGTVFTDGPIWSFTTVPVAPPPPNQPPVAGLTSDVSSGVGPFDVVFTLTSSDPDGTVASGVLNYGDGSPAVNISTPGASINRTHTYAAVGSLTHYTATWIVTDNQGATSTTASRNITVDTTPPPPPNQPPVPGLSASVTSGTGPFPVTLTLTSSDPDGTVASGVLDYGDDTPTLAITSPPASTTRSHTYAAVGANTNYTASWTITDNSGATAAKTVIITDNAPPPPPNQPPVAGIASNISSGVGPLTVIFTLTSSDPDGTVASGVLDYGDGSTANISSPAVSIQRTHTYAAVASSTTYQAKWNVTDNLGATSPIVSRNITVSPTPPPPPPQYPIAGIGANPTAGIGPFQTIFSLSSFDPDGTVASGVLDFGDGSNLTINSPPATRIQAHTYAAVIVDNTYTASWTVKDNSGLSSSPSTCLVFVQAVSQPPTIALSSPSEGQIGTAPASFTLTAVAQAGTNPISKVEFYRDSTLVNTDSVAPYTYNLTGVAAGNYTLTAKVYDNQSAPLVGTSPAVHIHVIAAGTAVVPMIIFVTP